MQVQNLCVVGCKRSNIGQIMLQKKLKPNISCAEEKVIITIELPVVRIYLRSCQYVYFFQPLEPAYRLPDDDQIKSNRIIYFSY